MGSPVDLSVVAENLKKKEYTTSAISQYGDKFGTHVGIGAQAESIGAPRTFGMEVKVHFGAGV